MANHKSAEKRIRRNARREVINGNRRSRMRTYVKKVVQATEQGDVPAAEAALRTAQTEILRGVSKGIIHRNTAARKISRLSSHIKELKTAK